MDAGSEAPALDYPWASPPAGGTLRKVAPGVFWARMPLPFRLDHINLWMLEDGPGWTVVDTGYAGEHTTRHLWEQIFAAGCHPTRVIVTHHHADHLGLAGWICAKFGAPLWMSRAEWLNGQLRRHGWSEAQLDSRSEHYRACGLSESELRILRARDGVLARSVATVPSAYCRLAEGQELTIGGTVWQVIVGEGHSPEHVALYSPASGVLLSGDQILPTISPHVGVWPEEPDANPLGAFLASLKKFLRLPQDTLVLPAHGLPFRGLHARVHSLLAHHTRRLEQTEDECRTWRSGAEIAALLFRSNLDPHQLALALSESLAHLHQLKANDQLEVAIDATGVRRFRRRS